MWSFTKECTWELIDDLPEEGVDLNDYDNIKRASGYELIESWGDDSGEQIVVWIGERGDRIVVMDSVSSFSEIHCPDVPAFLEFMRLHGHPWLAMSARNELRDELLELKGLLTDSQYGIFGYKFATALRNKWHQDEIRAEHHRRKRAEREAQAQASTP